MKISDLTKISLFITLMIVGAFIKIPFPFIEITLQSFFAILAGLMLGHKKGFMVTFLYMVIGLIGIPIFARGGGIYYVLTPSFGFILSFIPASFISGYLYHIKKTSKYIAAIIGVFVIYIIGAPYMYLILTIYKGTDMVFISLMISFIPYFIKDIFLSIFGAYVLKYLNPLITAF